MHLKMFKKKVGIPDCSLAICLCNNIEKKLNDVNVPGNFEIAEKVS